MLNYIKLNKGEVWNMGAVSQPREPKVLEGEAWVTTRGCAKDFILKAGDRLPAYEDLVVEPLSAELTISWGG